MLFLLKLGCVCVYGSILGGIFWGLFYTFTTLGGTYWFYEYFVSGINKFFWDVFSCLLKLEGCCNTWVLFGLFMVYLGWSDW